MKESIKPFMLPQTEMKPVHGHTRIVLTNSASGHIVKDVESENTFQSQILADLFDNIPLLNQQNNRSWSDMVGGLLLFRDSIPVGSRFMPAGNVMIGNGYRDATNSSTPVELGSFNSIDSYARFNQQTGKPVIYQVWDFNNNQGNGRISSVCLTSRIGGAIGYGNASGDYRNTDWNLRSFSQDNSQWSETFGEDDKTYSFYVNSDGTVSVTERRRVSVQGSAFSGLSTSYTITPSPAYSGSISANSVMATYIGNNKFRFAPHKPGGSGSTAGLTFYTSGSNIQYFEFDATNKTITTKSFINTYSTSVFTKIPRVYHYTHCSFIFTRNNKVICMSSDWETLVVFDLSDSSYKTISRSGYKFVRTNYDDSESGEIGEDLYIVHNASGESWRSLCIADLVNGTVFPCNTANNYSGCANVINSKGLSQTKYNEDTANVNYYFPNPLYLATINNITPVQKDATLTMRVMYTLEEA